MSKRKKNAHEDTFENAEGFQVKDINDVDEELAEEEVLPESADSSLLLADDMEVEDDDSADQEEDEHFKAVAENEDWEEGYDY
jgi:hypothetical protein